MQWRALHGCGGSKRGSLRPRRPRQRGLARTGDVRFCFARSLVARPSSRRARERAMAWIRRRRKTRAARRAMKRATIDETTELSSARRGGGGRSVAPRRRGGCHGGRRALRPEGWFGARGQGWAFGADSTYFRPFGVGFGVTPQQTKQQGVAISKADQRGMRQPRCAPSPRAFASDRIFLGGLP